MCFVHSFGSKLQIESRFEFVAVYMLVYTMLLPPRDKATGSFCMLYVLFVTSGVVSYTEIRVFVVRLPPHCYRCTQGRLALVALAKRGLSRRRYKFISRSQSGPGPFIPSHDARLRHPHARRQCTRPERQREKSKLIVTDFDRTRSSAAGHYYSPLRFTWAKIYTTKRKHEHETLFSFWGNVNLCVFFFFFLAQYQIVD